MANAPDLELLCRLQAIPGPAGDEGAIARFIEEQCARVSGAAVRNVHDLVRALATEGPAGRTSTKQLKVFGRCCG